MKFTILQHNGIDVNTYPENEWVVAPFPFQKMPIYNNDNLATVNRAYYLKEEKFCEAFKEAQRAWTDVSRDISWRLHVLLWGFDLSLRRKKNPLFLELGTGKGFMARAICEYFKNIPFRAILCDTWLPDIPLKTEGPLLVNNNKRFSYAEDPSYVAELDEILNNVERKFHFQIGVLPDSLQELKFAEKIDFLHVDLNNASAEKASLLYLSRFLNEECIILFDDTGAPGSEDQQEVHRSFASSIGKPLLYLPTGQALIM